MLNEVQSSSEKPQEISPNPEVNSSANTVVKNEKPRGKSPVLKFIMLGVLFAIGVALIGIAYYLGAQKSINQTVENSISPSPTDSISTSGWKTFTLNTVGLEFKLPQEFSGNLTEEIQDSKDLPDGAAKGSVYCAYVKKSDMSFIPKAYAGGALACVGQDAILTFGGASPDLEVGREGAYSDFQGFIKNGENYEVRFVADKLFPTNDVKTSYSKNKNGVEILKVYGKDQEGLSIWPHEGTILVIINTNNSLYRGISLAVDTSKISEAKLDQILTTFKFTDSIPQNSSQNYLEIKELGIKIPLTNKNKDAYHTTPIKTQNNTSWVYLKVHSLDSEKYCNDGNSTGLAAISRVPKDEIDQRTGEKFSNSGLGTTIGDYYFYMEGSQAVCSQDKSNQTNEVDARKAFLEKSKNIQPL